MEVILLALGLVAIAFLLLGIRIFFIKGRSFPQTEVGKNDKMRELGLFCVKCEERRKFMEAQKKFALKHIKPAELKIDLS